MCNGNREKKLKKIAEQGSYCERCSNHFEESELTLHHVIPQAILRENQKYPEDNYMVVCKKCHCDIHHRLQKGSRFWEYIAERFPAIRSDKKMSNFIRDLKTSTILLKV